MYFLAWSKGLKTTYYLRTLAATQIEKSTVDINKYGFQPRWMKNKSASDDMSVARNTSEQQPHEALADDGGVPLAVSATDMSSVEACSLDDPDCEACQ
jgi:ribonucleoside-diphosphate reductase alpha chain